MAHLRDFFQSNSYESVRNGQKEKENSLNNKKRIELAGWHNMIFQSFLLKEDEKDPGNRYRVELSFIPDVYDEKEEFVYAPVKLFITIILHGVSKKTGEPYNYIGIPKLQSLVSALRTSDDFDSGFSASPNTTEQEALQETAIYLTSRFGAKLKVELQRVKKLYYKDGAYVFNTEDDFNNGYCSKEEINKPRILNVFEFLDARMPNEECKQGSNKWLYRDLDDRDKVIYESLVSNFSKDITNDKLIDSINQEIKAKNIEIPDTDTDFGDEPF